MNPPSEEERYDILVKMLKKEDNVSRDINLSYVASSTPDFTGSELRELIRVASLQRAKEMMIEIKKVVSKNSSEAFLPSSEAMKLKFPLKFEHLEYALKTTKKSGTV